MQQGDVHYRLKYEYRSRPCEACKGEKGCRTKESTTAAVYSTREVGDYPTQDKRPDAGQNRPDNAPNDENKGYSHPVRQRNTPTPGPQKSLREGLGFLLPARDRSPTG